MKICFNSLGPKSSVTLGNKIYKNGSSIDVDDEIAKAFIDCKLAFEIKNLEDENEVIAIQRLDQKNVKKRNEILKKVKNFGQEGE